MRVAVVAVGDELLLGDVVNRNLAWLGSTLAAAGIAVGRGYEVGDGVDDVVEVLGGALEGADVVLVSGGLGPTSDDRTRDALARIAGVQLHTDDRLVAHLTSWFAERGRPMPPQALAQAQVPEGARPVANPLGSAPGLVLQLNGRTVYALPGVPAELRAMVAATVVPELRRVAGNPPPLLTLQLRVAVLGESAVAARLAPFEAALPHGVQLAYLASPGEVRVRLTGTDPTLLADARAQAEAVLGDVVSGRDDETLAATVLRILGERGATLSVAESLTGGALASALVDVPGASTVLRGAVVAYATPLKAQLLGVPDDLLARAGPVDPGVALAMARGVRKLVGSHWGVATTGVAGPDAQDGAPPGLAYVAVAGPDGTGTDAVVRVLVRADRDLVRALTVVHALDVLRRSVLGLPAEPDHSAGLVQEA